MLIGKYIYPGNAFEPMCQLVVLYLYAESNSNLLAVESKCDESTIRRLLANDVSVVFIM